MSTNDHAIVVIDDEEHVRDLLKLIVRKSGHSSLPFPSASLAIKEQDFSQVFFAIVDLQMPGMHGDEFIRELLPLYPHMNFLLITASNLNDELEELVAMERVHFMQKPFAVKDIIEMINLYSEEAV